jgi:hypothetical protein
MEPLVLEAMSHLKMSFGPETAGHAGKEEFLETASEFLCEGVSRCLLEGYPTGAIGRISPVLTHKVARSRESVFEN